MDVEILGTISGFLGAGSVIYLVVEHLLNKAKTKNEIEGMKQQNNLSAVEVYKQIDGVVEEKLRTYRERNEKRMEEMNNKIDKMGNRVRELETVKCYRLECKDRDLTSPEEDEMIEKNKIVVA